MDGRRRKCGPGGLSGSRISRDASFVRPYPKKTFYSGGSHTPLIECSRRIFHASLFFLDDPKKMLKFLANECRATWRDGVGVSVVLNEE